MLLWNFVESLCELPAKISSGHISLKVRRRNFGKFRQCCCEHFPNTFLKMQLTSSTYLYYPPQIFINCPMTTYNDRCITPSEVYGINPIAAKCPLKHQSSLYHRFSDVICFTFPSERTWSATCLQHLSQTSYDLVSLRPKSATPLQHGSSIIPW